MSAGFRLPRSSNGSPVSRPFITLTLLLPAAAFAQTGGSVSVRPFTNITGEPGDAWIGAAIAETLIADLLGAPGFEVVTGEQIGAPWVVSGAYQRVGNQIRITARLVEVASGRRDPPGDGRRFRWTISSAFRIVWPWT